MAVHFSFGIWLARGWWFYLWRWWLERRVVVLGFSKGRGFAASFFSTTPKPPLKGALVAALLRSYVPMAVGFPLGMWLVGECGFSFKEVVGTEGVVLDF